MGLFDGLGKAETTINRRYDTEGIYVQLIERILTKETRKSGTAVILEKRNLMCIDPCGASKPHTVGERTSHVMTSNKDSFLGNVKAVITQLARGLNPDFDEDAVTDQEWVKLADRMVGEKQPFAGIFVIVTNTTVTTSNDKPFTKVSYDEVISASQLKDMLIRGEVDIDRLFPDGELDAMIAEEEGDEG